MDINSLSQALTGQSATAQTTDLLVQLRAAGAIEAEVIRVLEGKLLLSSRLGDILTTNTLNYKTGDRLNIRLGGSELAPVLKVSSQKPEPVLLDSARNPRLNRLLPTDQAVLAVVTRVAAQRMEIRLAGQVLTLPRQPGIAKEQLISLKRSDTGRAIAITPVDRKLIYKAILKQLLPRQSDLRPASLVKLLGMVNRAIDSQLPELTRVSVNTRQPGPSRVDDKSSTPRSEPIRSLTPVQGQNDRGSTTSATGTSRTKVVTRSLVSVPASLSETRTAPQSANSRQVNSLLRQINRSNKPVAPAENPVSAVPRPGSSVGKPSLSATPVPMPKVSVKMPSQNSAVQIAGTTPARSNPARQTTPAETLPQPAPPASHGARQTHSTLPHASLQPQGSVPTGSGETIVNRTNAQPTAPKARPSVFQMLLQLVPRLADIDAQQLKQWFEYASLIRTAASAATLVTPKEPFKILQQLGSQEAFGRELLGSLQTVAGTATKHDPAEAKVIPEDLLLQQIRDGIKLVEQSLSQNLLQRASLGMQQETHQPFSLSLSLPFLEQREIRPLHIDLEQRTQTQEAGEPGWDIRLNFEFASLGPIACHLFVDTDTVTASFYSEQDQTRCRIEQALPELQQQLRDAGFMTGEFHSFAGNSAQPRTTATSGYSESLIDIEV
jgi:hypothetical protein